MSGSGFKIAVVGLGRVGLPFSLSLHEAGFSITGVDINTNWLEQLKNKPCFPFHEPGYDRLPEEGDHWKLQSHFEGLDAIDAFVITVGTPLDSNLTPDLRPIKAVVDALAQYLSKGKLIIFRSTLGLGVTSSISKYLQTIRACQGGQPNIAYCPERLAEGKAKLEISSLPQIVSASDAQARQTCHTIFSRLTSVIHDVSFREAELIKLLCNTSRYMQFAISNWVHEFILDHDVDPHTLLSIANDQYPRPIPDKPGFTAGTCLRKDYGLLVQDQVIGDYPLAAWRVNERQPLSLVNAALKNVDLSGARVCILGIGFKRDVDDLRDSLAIKLAELFHRRCKSVFFHDPFISYSHLDLGMVQIEKVDYETMEKDMDVLVIGANHSEYERLADRIQKWSLDRKVLVIDMWNVSGFGQSVTQLGG